MHLALTRLYIDDTPVLCEDPSRSVHWDERLCLCLEARKMPKKAESGYGASGTRVHMLDAYAVFNLTRSSVQLGHSLFRNVCRTVRKKMKTCARIVCKSFALEPQPSALVVLNPSPAWGGCVCLRPRPPPAVVSFVMCSSFFVVEFRIAA